LLLTLMKNLRLPSLRRGLAVHAADGGTANPGSVC
jgi:hypothetical protein